jgi:molybdate transport system substrate-binding protein
MQVLRAIRVVLVAALFLAASLAVPAAQPVVAAASDLKFALEEIAASFHKERGLVVRLSFGSSGTFATQIRNGAPFALYLSADEEYVRALHADGYTRDEGALYAIGRLVLMAPPGSELTVDGQLKGLATALRAGKIRRFAIANPEHAPYGQRAAEALRHVGLWSAIEPRLVLGENVSQAAQFAVSGSAQGGIVALSLAVAPQMKDLARYALIPAEWHSPLRQRMVLLKGADATAEAFYRYLQEPAARRVMGAYGFTLPGEPD